MRWPWQAKNPLPDPPGPISQPDHQSAFVGGFSPELAGVECHARQLLSLASCANPRPRRSSIGIQNTRASRGESAPSAAFETDIHAHTDAHPSCWQTILDDAVRPQVPETRHPNETRSCSALCYRPSESATTPRFSYATQNGIETVPACCAGSPLDDSNGVVRCNGDEVSELDCYRVMPVFQKAESEQALARRWQRGHTTRLQFWPSPGTRSSHRLGWYDIATAHDVPPSSKKATECMPSRASILIHDRQKDPQPSSRTVQKTIFIFVFGFPFPSYLLCTS